MTWRDSLLALLGYAGSIHDHRVHDANNKDQVALSGVQIAKRRAERAIIAKAQPDDARSEDLKRGTDTLRQTLEERAKRQRLDAIDAAFRGKDTP